MPSSDIRIETLEERHMKDLERIRRNFLNSKHFFCCLPGGMDSERDFRKDYKKCPDFRNVCGVAVLPEKGVVGFCQLLLEGMPSDMHTSKAGEAYILMLGVEKDARGMGAGSALLEWAEKIARERSCTFMSLEVMHGNPAIGLYERKGYVAKPAPLWQKILCAIPLMCFMGPVICPAGGPSYCNYGLSYYMEKPIE